MRNGKGMERLCAISQTTSLSSVASTKFGFTQTSGWNGTLRCISVMVLSRWANDHIRADPDRCSWTWLGNYRARHDCAQGQAQSRCPRHPRQVSEGKLTRQLATWEEAATAEFDPDRKFFSLTWRCESGPTNRT